MVNNYILLYVRVYTPFYFFFYSFSNISFIYLFILLAFSIVFAKLTIHWFRSGFENNVLGFAPGLPQLFTTSIFFYFAFEEKNSSF